VCGYQRKYAILDGLRNITSLAAGGVAQAMAYHRSDVQQAAWWLPCHLPNGLCLQEDRSDADGAWRGTNTVRLTIAGAWLWAALGKSDEDNGCPEPALRAPDRIRICLVGSQVLGPCIGKTCHPATPAGGAICRWRIPDANRIPDGLPPFPTENVANPVITILKKRRPGL
jgi:hypothetical protein